VGAALTAAARRGLAGAGVDPFTGRAAGARSLLSRLVEYVSPALARRGDAGTVTALLHRLDHWTTGAGRQQALFFGAESAPAFVAALAQATRPD
jgi:glutamate---cysteine ligase / carboxylate-amine ligase